MEKLRLNNEIVSMRHSVRKAQVHIVHRLTREINKLKNRKGNEKQVEKCKRKAERLIEELQNIKKLKEDDVSKFAIKNTRELQEILTDLQSSCLERALGRLACHPDVEAHVRKLRSEPVDWVALLDDLGSQTKMKKKKNKKQKTKQNENLQKYEPGRFVRIRHTSSSEDLTSDVVISEEIETSDEAKWEHKIKKPNIYPDAAVGVNISVNKNKSKPKNTNPVASDVPQHSVKRKNVASEENVSSGDNNNFSESSDQEREHLSDERVIRSATSENLKSLQPDPFFLTDEGEYLSSIVKSESVHSEEQTMKKLGNSSSRVSTKYPKMNRNQKAKNAFNDELRGPMRVKDEYRHMNEGRRTGMEKERKRFQGEPLKRKHTLNTHIKRQNTELKTSQNDAGVSLHPSWEAKKKMQQQQLNIHAFQGKKIKFDDDE
ncbi:serum response factor-binding protein 1 [Schistocerca piceifrons]|uniref:serum response factor-binding protein 1 n=1 Tax=Schistocerca piceifrons TaxID=274613 RepID=UPI001F5E7004|nr:serum response factor-binding protein 1 [Schistocerca piceifrons]